MRTVARNVRPFVLVPFCSSFHGCKLCSLAVSSLGLIMLRRGTKEGGGVLCNYISTRGGERPLMQNTLSAPPREQTIIVGISP